MDVGKGREQDAETLSGFYLFLHGCKSLGSVEVVSSPPSYKLRVAI